MNDEEINKLEDYLKSLPKIKQNMSIPVTTNIGINLDDLMNAVKGLKKVPTFDDLEKENQQLKRSLQTHEILLKANVEENKQLKEKLEKERKVRKEALDLIEKLRFEKWAITGTDIMDVIDILDIDKGE